MTIGKTDSFTNSQTVSYYLLRTVTYLQRQSAQSSETGEIGHLLQAMSRVWKHSLSSSI